MRPRFFFHNFETMETALIHLVEIGGTALISFFIAWLKKKADIKSIKNGSKDITTL